MKKRYILILLTLFLISCAKGELRKDIKEFIANFDFQVAVNEYQNASYEWIDITTDEEKTIKKVTNFYFNIKDRNNIEYKKDIKLYKDDEITDTSLEEITYIDEKIYLSSSKDGLKEINEEKALEIISSFFYIKSEYQNNYHTGAMYYGDLVKEVAYDVQDLITIDLDNNLYIYEYKDYVSEGANSSQKYIVDRYGMLVSNQVSQNYKSSSITTSIEVKKY